MKKIVFIIITFFLFGCSAKSKEATLSSSSSTLSSSSVAEVEGATDSSTEESQTKMATVQDLDLSKLIDSKTGEYYQKPDNINQLVGSYQFTNPEFVVDPSIPSPAIIQLQINSDGSYRKLVIQASYDMTNNVLLNSTPPMAYFDESNTFKLLENGAITIGNFNYLWIDKITYSRGILVSKFDKTYLIPLETNLAPSSFPLLNSDGKLDATRSVIDQSIGRWALSKGYSSSNTFTVPQSEDEIAELFNEYVVNTQTHFSLDEYNLTKYSSINSTYEFSDTKTLLSAAKTDDVYDVVKYPLSEILTSQFFNDYVTTANDVFQTAFGPFITKNDTYSIIGPDILNQLYLQNGNKVDDVTLGIHNNNKFGNQTITIYRNGKIIRDIVAQDGIYIIPNE